MSDDRNLKIARLMDERGLKPYPFAKANEIASSTMTSIYKGKVQFENISINTFLKIAHGLGMTAEELYYDEKAEPGMDERSHPSISADEQVVVDGYRIADATQKRRMLSAAKLEIEMAEESALEKKEAI